MTVFQCILFLFLIVCAVSVSFSRNLLNSVLIYMSFSLIMSIVWVTLQSPDLAITEAAVGAGVTSLLFFATLKKIHAIDTRLEQEQKAAEEAGQDKAPQESGQEVKQHEQAEIERRV